MNAKPLAKKCSRDHVHIRIEGRYTKPSATYCAGLAIALARLFRRRIEAIYAQLGGEDAERGLEDVLTDEVLLTSQWKVVRDWKWRGSSHINILEAAAALKAFESVALRGGDLRFVSLIDSHVALCALVRGRSSSMALRHILKRASTISLAYGLYHAGHFAPTRMNPADHPTRDTDIPEPLLMNFERRSEEEFRWLASLRGLRRWTANWLRLCLLLSPSWISFFSHDACMRRYGLLLDFQPPVSLDFDSTLGFPGEGPMRLFSCLFPLLTGRFSRRGRGEPW